MLRYDHKEEKVIVINIYIFSICYVLFSGFSFGYRLFIDHDNNNVCKLY